MSNPSKDSREEDLRINRDVQCRTDRASIMTKMIIMTNRVMMITIDLCKTHTTIRV